MGEFLEELLKWFYMKSLEKFQYILLTKTFKNNPLGFYFKLLGRIPAGFFKRSLYKIPEITGLISKAIAELGSLVEIFEESSREIPIGNYSRFFCKNTYGALQKIPGCILRKFREKISK